MCPRQATRIRSRSARAVILPCIGTLLASISARTSAQCLPANAVEVQSGQAFDYSLRVNAVVPSLFANRTPQDGVLTCPRNVAATKSAGNSQTALLTTSFACASTSMVKTSSLSFVSVMLQHSSVQGCISLPSNSSTADQSEVQPSGVIARATYQPTDFNSDGAIDFFDYLDFLQAPDSMFDGSVRNATSP